MENKGRTIFHVHFSIRWLLRQPKGKLKGLLLDEAGRILTPDQARDSLMDYLADGKELLPVDGCDNFDYKTGCKGHPIE